MCLKWDNIKIHGLPSLPLNHTECIQTRAHGAARVSEELAGVGGAQRPLLIRGELGQLGLVVTVIDSLAYPLSKQRRGSLTCAYKHTKIKVDLATYLSLSLYTCHHRFCKAGLGLRRARRHAAEVRSESPRTRGRTEFGE